ncbi:hypothetical protein RRG08_005984 [Elysia crispata]|uniref:Uncharacterized protein n=1 Tax=Elysia crispata TaxID=231223 RepID=A0AAE0YQ68_9GAST|nr:hypothetical protein RRG08_005984 [Elysia crispata]
MVNKAQPAINALITGALSCEPRLQPSYASEKIPGNKELNQRLSQLFYTCMQLDSRCACAVLIHKINVACVAWEVLQLHGTRALEEVLNRDDINTFCSGNNARSLWPGVKLQYGVCTFIFVKK